MGLHGRGGTLGAVTAGEFDLGAEVLRVGTDRHRKQRARRARGNPRALLPETPPVPPRRRRRRGPCQSAALVGALPCWRSALIAAGSPCLQDRRGQQGPASLHRGQSHATPRNRPVPPSARSPLQLQPQHRLSVGGLTVHCRSRRKGYEISSVGVREGVCSPRVRPWLFGWSGNHASSPRAKRPSHAARVLGRTARTLRQT